MELMFNTIMVEPNRWARDRGLTQPLAALLPAIHARGFRALEIWQYHVSDLTLADVDKLAGDLRAVGMTAPALGAYPEFHLEGSEQAAMEALLERLVAAAQVLGATTMKVFPGRLASGRMDVATRALSVERLQRLAGRLAERGMQLTLETHANTLCDSIASTTRLLQELRDQPHVGLCLQPYADQDTDAAVAMFDLLRPSVRHLHLQNRARGGGPCTRLADGDWIDYRRFLSHVMTAGFTGLLGLEFTAGISPAEGRAFELSSVLDSAAQDLAFVRSVCARHPCRRAPTTT